MEVKKCPVCGGELVHPVAVYIRTGDALHTVTSKGYDEKYPVWPWPCTSSSPRGVVIGREYLGECGHRWLETEQFHKGQVLEDCVELVSYAGPMETIWRD